MLFLPLLCPFGRNRAWLGCGHGIQALHQHACAEQKVPNKMRLRVCVLPLPTLQVCLVRDTFVSTLFNPSHFLDHTTFDCGKL